MTSYPSREERQVAELMGREMEEKEEEEKGAPVLAVAGRSDPELLLRGMDCGLEIMHCQREQEQKHRFEKERIKRMLHETNKWGTKNEDCASQ